MKNLLKKQIITIVAGCALLVVMNSSIVNAQNQYFVSEAVVLNSSVRYIRVTENRPIEECRDVAVVRNRSRRSNSDTPEILGALLGGAIGKELDDSNTSVGLGALLGASIGSDIEKRNRNRNSETVIERQCTMIERAVQVEKIDGYNVTFEFNGKVLNGVVPRDPGPNGSRIRVRIGVTPVL